MDLNLRTETFGRGNQTWLGSQHGTDMLVPATLKTSLFTAGTHYPEGFFPSGTTLAMWTTAGANFGLFGPYTPGGANGLQVYVGQLMDDVKAPAVNTLNVAGSLFQHGRIIVANLPIPASIDSAAKTAAAGRIIFA